ncbi:MAG TPA: alanyl-tRNA editing protein [Candidatus Sulfopaludibacter sp.]|nr:alanyl-tRNA editing protein [Candidatus Sulfopaludibacter sp.]
MSNRLYYTDSYLRDFTAAVVDTAGEGRIAYLDHTAFYPASGGQPADAGSIAGAFVVDVVDEGERIAHHLAAAVAADSRPVPCCVDWRRRFDHMQQHTGQHLLSAVFQELFHLKTVSFHMGADSSTIDLEGGNVDARTLQEVGRRANEVVFENRPVTVLFEDASAAQGLRKPSEREGTLRIISIDRLDRSACGGTHVRSTGEIGAITLRKLDKVRQTARVEFLCGARAIRRAHADYEALYKASQLFSSPLDEVPALIAAQQEAARAAEKSRRKLELDLAAYRGRELYGATAPGPDGFRRLTQRIERGTLEELRAVAQSFTAQPRAVFLAALADPPSVLLAVSEDAGIDAGKQLKAAIAEAGGRGGGTARIAQGSVSDAAALETVLGKL